MRRRVLCIEDNPVNQALFARLFGRRPEVECVMATSASAGLAAASSLSPDLVICDLHLPDFDGDEVVRQLREAPDTASIPVAMVSADATGESRSRLMALGADAYLTKPFDISAFYTLVDRYLGRA